ncbi:MAG TPA: hypothetical protein VGB17_11170 [Pyrinomonadaceae bacterium]|jgi:hypothetical protein
MLLRFFSSFILLACLTLALAGPASAVSPEAEALARRAVSENTSESEQAIARLRAMGPEGLRTLFEVYASEIERQLQDASDAASRQKDPAWQRLSAALDAVGQQRNAYTSRLYWYTDFAAAKAAAQKSGKPILSLRLLGRLNEELSCANSRFFRTALYSNAQISTLLRERFILHWKSVRPAPRVTVDFGDGRKFESTITGNSIHYILDPDGRVLDALPGLYGPQAFLRELSRMEALAKELQGQTDEQQRAKILRAFHDERIDALAKSWANDLEKTGVKLPREIEAANPAEKRPPSARAAERMAMTKAITENGIVNAITFDARTLQSVTDEAAWAKIAALHADDARLDQNSLSLMRRQNPNLREIAPQTTQLSSDEALFLRLKQNFERYIALDTVRNEYWLHTKLHAWLLNARFPNDLEALNERVYAELFLTPRTDPWLGLYAPDAYTALDHGGVSR